jgi:ribose 5-phosphate isomerase B
MSIAANKVPGIRAALCDNELEAQLARAHNDANVLCLGGRIVGPALAGAIVERFLTTSFEGGRHQGRLDKIAALHDGSPAKRGRTANDAGRTPRSSTRSRRRSSARRRGSS